MAALVKDEVVLSVMRRYLGAEPELLECTLVVHDAEAETPVHPQRRFHLDYGGWQSLNLFVYLTAVEADSGAHEIVVGTHHTKSLRDVVRSWVPDHEIALRFGAQVRTITGPAGTLFFEDTEAFHRRLAMKRRRVMLSIGYASHRGVMSHGRLGRPYMAYVSAQRKK